MYWAEWPMDSIRRAASDGSDPTTGTKPIIYTIKYPFANNIFILSYIN